MSIEMLEVVGYRYLPGYFETVDRLLAPEGIAVIPSITLPDVLTRSGNRALGPIPGDPGAA